MKNLILSIALLIGISAVSCKKEENTKPQTPATPRMIDIEYRIQSETGNLNASYLAPNTSGELEYETEVVDRNEYSIKFSIMSGQFLSVEASNVFQSHRTVQVELYINGGLVKQSISNSPSEKAGISGTYY